MCDCGRGISYRAAATFGTPSPSIGMAGLRRMRWDLRDSWVLEAGRIEAAVLDRALAHVLMGEQPVP